MLQDRLINNGVVLVGWGGIYKSQKYKKVKRSKEGLLWQIGCKLYQID